MNEFSYEIPNQSIINRIKTLMKNIHVINIQKIEKVHITKYIKLL